MTALIQSRPEICHHVTLVSSNNNSMLSACANESSQDKDDKCLEKVTSKGSRNLIAENNKNEKSDNKTSELRSHECHCLHNHGCFHSLSLQFLYNSFRYILSGVTLTRTYSVRNLPRCQVLNDTMFVREEHQYICLFHQIH